MHALKSHRLLHTTQHTPRHTAKFQAPAQDDDELIQMINQDASVERVGWEMTGDVEGEQLENFWNKVEKDISNDPEWLTFAEE